MFGRKTNSTFKKKHFRSSLKYHLLWVTLRNFKFLTKFVGALTPNSESNIIETERIETARYSNKAYFAEKYFLYFREIIIFCKSLKLIIIIIFIFLTTTIQLTILLCTFLLLYIVFKVPQDFITYDIINECLVT